MLEPGFYNMDCMEGMRQFPDKFFDLAIVDPPYGIDICSKTDGITVKIGGGGVSCQKNYHPFNDIKIPDTNYFDELKRVSKNQIIWGGNYFLDNLGPTSCFICWDKYKDVTNYADGEFAWTSFKMPAKIFRFKWHGMLQQDMKNKEDRIHPTQKPVVLYEWLLSQFAKPGMKILDTHVGSASSLIACHRAGLDYWGFEIDEVYYKMAKERLDKEKAQVNMFDVVKETRTEQVSLI